MALNNGISGVKKMLKVCLQCAPRAQVNNALTIPDQSKHLINLQWFWGLWPGLHPIQSGTHIHSTLTIQYRLGRRSITVAVALSHFLRLVMRDHATDEVNCRITDKPGTFATTITTSTTDSKQTSVSQHVTCAADCLSAQPVWNRCQHPHTKRGKTRTMVKLPVLGKSLKYIEIYWNLKDLESH